MEKNKKDKKKQNLISNNNGGDNPPLEVSIFDFDELTLNVLSHLPFLELINVRFVCKKWSMLVWEPTIWKRVFINTLGNYFFFSTKFIYVECSNV